MGFNSAFKGLKLLKNPGNRRLNNLNDPVLNVLIRRRYLLQPEVFWQAEKFGHVDGLAKSICIQTVLLRNVTNSCRLCNVFIVNTSKNPVKDAGVLPKTRPKKLSLERDEIAFRQYYETNSPYLLC